MKSKYFKKELKLLTNIVCWELWPKLLASSVWKLLKKELKKNLTTPMRTGKLSGDHILSVKFNIFSKNNIDSLWLKEVPMRPILSKELLLNLMFYSTTLWGKRWLMRQSSSIWNSSKLTFLQSKENSIEFVLLLLLFCSWMWIWLQ